MVRNTHCHPQVTHSFEDFPPLYLYYLYAVREEWFMTGHGSGRVGTTGYHIIPQGKTAIRRQASMENRQASGTSSLRLF